MLAIFFSFRAQSTTSHSYWAISLDGSGRPANDLLYRGELLTSAQALELGLKGIDLSQLSPQNSEVWSSIPTPPQQSLTITEESTVHFSDVILSNRGVLRFNALNPQDNNLYTIYLDKRAHITLLRAALLSRLGYRLPPMKHLKKLSVSFPTRKSRDNFLSERIPLGTFGAASRWIGIQPEQLPDDQLTVEFHDVIAFLPRETDHYNPAMGVPPERLTSRTLRALLLPYALLFAGESINKLPWNTGRKLDNKIILKHFALADMGTTLDDAYWILRKMAQLTREDFSAIANEAALPEAVAILTTEKMISRRNSLMELFSIPTPPLSVDTNISFGEDLVNGKLTRTRWKGHASHFAYSNAESPFKDFEYLGYSILQSSALTSFFSRINQELRGFDLDQKRRSSLNEQFSKAFDHYIDTGEIKDVGMKTWHSPILDIDLIANRNIVFGHYLGTDNMVQMADVIGYGISGGGHVGIENDNAFSSNGVNAQITFLKTYAHVRPIISLKKAFQESYSKILVPLTKGKLLEQLEEFKNNPDNEKILERLNSLLPKGESLIITESILPRASIKLGGYALMGGTFQLKTSTESQTIRRIHIHRKNSTTIDIYDDRGEGHKISFSGNYSRYIPIFSSSEKKHEGKYGVQFYRINIDNNVGRNPDFHKNIVGLYQVMSEGSAEILKEHADSWLVNANFHDRINNTNFLIWRGKSLNGELDFHLKKVKAGVNEPSLYNYVIYEKGHRSGLNLESFLKDIANYYLTDWMADKSFIFQIENNRNANPGQSIYGQSEILLASYQAKKHRTGTHHESPLIVISQKKKGFHIDKNGLLDYIENVNTQYSEKLFEPYSLENLDGLWLYDLNIITTIHTRGIEEIKRLEDETLRQIQRTYLKERRNRPECRHRPNTTPTSQSLIACGHLKILIRKNQQCKRSQAVKQEALCLRDLGNMLKKYLLFEDFKKIIGAENYFVYGTLNGFHKNSETLSDTIYSHGLGRIHLLRPEDIVSMAARKLSIKKGELLGLWFRESL